MKVKVCKVYILILTKPRTKNFNRISAMVFTVIKRIIKYGDGQDII